MYFDNSLGSVLIKSTDCERAVQIGMVMREFQSGIYDSSHEVLRKKILEEVVCI